MEYKYQEIMEHIEVTPEMRERIGERIAQAAAADPGNAHLRQQEALLPHAQITTIDSFCLFVVRNYFQKAGLDPVKTPQREEIPHETCGRSDHRDRKKGSFLRYRPCRKTSGNALSLVPDSVFCLHIFVH